MKTEIEHLESIRRRFVFGGALAAIAVHNNPDADALYCQKRAVRASQEAHRALLAVRRTESLAEKIEAIVPGATFGGGE